MHREVLVSRNSTLSKNNNQSDNNTVPNKGKSFQQMQLLMKLFHSLNRSLKNLKKIKLSIQMEGKNNLKKLKVATQTHGQRIRVALLLEIP